MNQPDTPTDRDQALDELAKTLTIWKESTGRDFPENDTHAVLGLLLSIVRQEAVDTVLGELRARLANVPETMVKHALGKLLEDR